MFPYHTVNLFAHGFEFEVDEALDYDGGSDLSPAVFAHDACIRAFEAGFLRGHVGISKDILPDKYHPDQSEVSDGIYQAVSDLLDGILEEAFPDPTDWDCEDGRSGAELCFSAGYFTGLTVAFIYRWPLCEYTLGDAVDFDLARDAISHAAGLAGHLAANGIPSEDTNDREWLQHLNPNAGPFGF